MLAWERIAVVTDVDRVRRGVSAFAWMIHGEVRVVGMDGLDEATAWVTEGLAPS